MGGAARRPGGKDRASPAGVSRAGRALLRPDGEALTRPALSAVLFDWDGTLVDSAEASYRCYARLFPSFGIRFDRARFEETYSPDWHRTYALVGLPEQSWSQADACWLELYDEEEPRMLPGAAEAVARLKQGGLALAVVTSGSRSRVERELAQFRLGAFFEALVCAEDSARKKPHPEPLRLGLERLGVPSERAACVGDSPEDVEMARAAGVFSVGVPGGFPNREALKSARPDLWAAGLSEAVGQLLSLAGRDEAP
ncbi:MAG: HAD family hydrolase [Thermoanaerobaculia bacterium]